MKRMNNQYAWNILWVEYKIQYLDRNKIYLHNNAANAKMSDSHQSATIEKKGLKKDG